MRIIEIFLPLSSSGAAGLKKSPGCQCWVLEQGWLSCGFPRNAERLGGDMDGAVGWVLRLWQHPGSPRNAREAAQHSGLLLSAFPACSLPMAAGQTAETSATRSWRPRAKMECVCAARQPSSPAVFCFPFLLLQPLQRRGLRSISVIALPSAITLLVDFPAMAVPSLCHPSAPLPASPPEILTAQITGDSGAAGAPSLTPGLRREVMEEGWDLRGFVLLLRGWISLLGQSGEA